MKKSIIAATVTLAILALGSTQVVNASMGMQGDANRMQAAAAEAQTVTSHVSTTADEKSQVTGTGAREPSAYSTPVSRQAN